MEGWRSTRARTFHVCVFLFQVEAFLICLKDVCQTSLKHQKHFSCFTNEIERPKEKSTKQRNVWEMCENLLGKK